MKNNIKMRVNTNKETICSNCGTKYDYTKEMYDIMLFNNVNHICFDCCETLFQKILTAQVKYQAKIKSKEDMKRIDRNRKMKSEE